MNSQSPYRLMDERIERCDTCSGPLRGLAPTCAVCCLNKNLEVRERTGQLVEFMQKAMWVRA